MPSISVVIPAFNAEEYLPRCIDSLLKQSFKDFEIIIIDDGSTDRTEKICDQYATIHDIIRVIHISNSGVSAARNLGTSIANGTHITYVDADDYVSPSFLSSFVDIGGLNADLSFTGFENNYPDISKNTTLFLEHCGSSITKKNVICDSINTCHCLTPWAKLYRVSLLKEHGIEFDTSLKYSEDRIFFSQFLSKAETFASSNIISYIYTHENPEALTLKRRPYNQMMRYINKYYPIIERLLNSINADNILRDKAHQLYAYEAIAMACDIVSDEKSNINNKVALIKQIPHELKKILFTTPMISKNYKLLSYALYKLPPTLFVTISSLFISKKYI